MFSTVQKNYVHARFNLLATYYYTIMHMYTYYSFTVLQLLLSVRQYKNGYCMLPTAATPSPPEE